MGKVGEFVYQVAVIGNATNFLHAAVEDHAGWAVRLVFLPPAFVEFGGSERIVEGRVDVVLLEVACVVNVFKSVLNIHAIVAPRGGVDFCNGGQIAEVVGHCRCV